MAFPKYGIIEILYRDGMAESFAEYPKPQPPPPAASTKFFGRTLFLDSSNKMIRHNLRGKEMGILGGGVGWLKYPHKCTKIYQELRMLSSVTLCKVFIVLFMCL